MINATAAWEKS